MRFVFYTNIVCPHTLPLVEAVAFRVGWRDVCYLYNRTHNLSSRDVGIVQDERLQMVCEREDPGLAMQLKREAHLLFSSERDLKSFLWRSANGHRTIFSTERWFKPFRVGLSRTEFAETAGCPVDGALRMMSPRYFKMTQQLVGLLQSDGGFFYYPIGRMAAIDALRAARIARGSVRAAISPPQLQFGDGPGTRIAIGGKGADADIVGKMRLWGYFVKPSAVALPINRNRALHCPIRILWIGRILGWKMVETIVRAVGASDRDLMLDIYGEGPALSRIQKISDCFPGKVSIHSFIPASEVRRVMREHDVLVLSSNQFEGWGAVVSEALEEGVRVIGTYEAGASRTILPETNLFHAGDWKALKGLLSNEIPNTGIGRWTAEAAAEHIVEVLNG